ncbi:hypothetical protein V1514DRAFT_198190 [Lipomyces japonicus]|uniref:uncharacterized protein n=1 Tax=Lipomyces japonicus TaxID=56871 RepID=UPI0034CDDDA6
MASIVTSRRLPVLGLNSLNNGLVLASKTKTSIKGRVPATYLNANVRLASSSALNYFSNRYLPRNFGILFVPERTAFVVERMGKFKKVLSPGLSFLIPGIDRVRYVKSLKESAFEIPSQSAITADNVTLEIDGVLYIQILDAYKASYGVEDADYAVQQLAQTTMRSEIGQLTLDHVLRERQELNVHITQAINEAAAAWGVKCLRYEIRDIHPPDNVLEAMHRQVSADRSKRAEILESEGQRQSAINIAEGKRQSVILASEAEKAETINRASGDAEAILLRAKATATGIKQVSEAIGQSPNGIDAVSLQVAEKYVEAFSKLAKESNTIVIPSQLGDFGGLIASGLGIYKNVRDAKTANQIVEPSEDK